MNILVVILLAAILITLLSAWGVMGWIACGILTCILVVILLAKFKAIFSPVREVNNLNAKHRKERDDLLSTIAKRTALGYDIDEQLERLKEIEQDL